MSEQLEFREIIESSLRRFGIELDELNDFGFDTTRKKYISIHSVKGDYDNSHSLSIGIPFLKHRLSHPKLTTAGALLLGHLATRNIVNLDADQSRKYLKCELMDLENSALENCDDKGFVIARHDGLSLGLAFQERDEDGLWLKGLYPARWRKGDILHFD